MHKNNVGTTYRDMLKFRYNTHITFIAEYLAPKIRRHETIIIGTHPETFHADEVMAVAILTTLLDKFGATYEVRRLSRHNQEQLEEATVLLDVGRTFDPSTGRFDHHQPGGAGRRITHLNRQDVPLSTCGLIWYACGLMLTGEHSDVQANDDTQTTLAFDKIDREVVRGIDASDNGLGMPNGFTINEADGSISEMPGSPLHFSKMIGQFNSSNIYDTEAQTRQFNQALALAKMVFQNALQDAISYANTRPQLLDALNRQVTGSPKVLQLDRYMRWSEHLPHLPEGNEVQMVISPLSGPKGEWNVTIVKRRNRFRGNPAPRHWCGKENADLEAAAGIPGLLFCHDHGHMLRTASLEAALAVADVLLGKSPIGAPRQTAQAQALLHA